MITYQEGKGWIGDELNTRAFAKCEKAEFEEIPHAPRYPAVDESGYVVYYFDGENGDDQNDGKTEKSAKKTLAEASKIAKKSEKTPTKILFKIGTTFEGNLVLEGFEPKEESPLLIGKYPEKAEGYPVLTGKNEIVKLTVGNVRIVGLEITGKDAYCGIWGVAKKTGATKNIVVEGNYVHDINFNWIYDTEAKDTDPDDIDVEKVCPHFMEDGVRLGRYFWRFHGGIIFLNDEPLPMEERKKDVDFSLNGRTACWFEDVWILSNRVERVARTGITMYSRWSNKGGVGYGFNLFVDDTEKYNVPEKGIGYYVHKRIYCNDNYLDCVGGDGLVLSSCEDSFIENNVCYRANYLGRSGYWNAAIWIFNGKNSYLQGNEAGYTYMRHGGQDAQGFDLDNVCENVVFQYNYGHHNEGGGLLMCNNHPPCLVYNEDGTPKERNEDGTPKKRKVYGKWLGNYVRNNVFYENGNRHDPTRSAFITIAREVDHVAITNNTVILSGEIENQSVINTEDESQFCYNHFYGGNVFYAKKPTGAKFTAKMLKDSTFDGNLYWNIDENSIKTLHDEHAIQTDPQFDAWGKEDGMESAERFVPKNESLFGKGTFYQKMGKYDFKRANVEHTPYLGAIAKKSEK